MRHLFQRHGFKWLLIENRGLVGHKHHLLRSVLFYGENDSPIIVMCRDNCHAGAFIVY